MSFRSPSSPTKSDFDPRKIFVLGVIGLLMLLTLAFTPKLIENVNATDFVVIQAPSSGHLRWYTNPGWAFQKFGTVTTYSRRNIYNFNVPVRFNDGGHGTMWGSIQYEMPIDTGLLTVLHTRFGSPEAVAQQLIQTVTNKSIYMTGPLMSSKESYAERRNDLIRFVEDQVAHGVYRTRSHETRAIDPLSGQEKTVIVVDIVMDSTGQPERQEQSVLDTYGIKTFNFAIDSLPYDPTVERQIRQQQDLAMQVQTSIAESRQAEQRAITAQKNGEANAAEARWRQEAVRSESVTVAQRRLDQARLDAEAAAQERLANIRRGEGEAARRRLVMQADGALEQKINAWVQINRAYAENFSQYGGSWVPSVVMGGNNSSTNGASDFMNLLTMQSARQLGLDLRIPNRPTGRDSVVGRR